MIIIGANFYDIWWLSTMYMRNNDEEDFADLHDEEEGAFDEEPLCKEDTSVDCIGKFFPSADH
ncbi:hypothetical protein E4U24_005394 [Claviceps purpurea]|nr:hypothetical protein E4U24_005394 [Claviceps purpurea]